MAYKGSTVNMIADASFQMWVYGLGSIKISERPIEGCHSMVTNQYKRAPTSTLATVSFELRYKCLCENVSQNPEASS